MIELLFRGYLRQLVLWLLGIRRLHDLFDDPDHEPKQQVHVTTVVQAGERSLAEGLAEERRAVLRTMGTKDQQEGMRAFLEKRRPVFSGE